MKQMTLCMIYQEPQLLLGMKKRGFGKDRWNGFGGKVKIGENIEEALHREVMEETGITLRATEKIGILEFEFKDSTESLEVHIFQSATFEGYPQETEEMRPQWFHRENVPYSEMWSDDIYWLPLFLENKKFKGKIIFDSPSSNTILHHSITSVEKL